MTYKTLSTLILCLIFLVPVSSQIKLKAYSQKNEKEYKFLADNDEYCPVSIKVDFTLNNMTSSNGNHKIFVVPPRTKGFLISKLKRIKSGKYSFRFKTKYNYGNHLDVIIDSDFVYSLPYKKGDVFKLSQGYYGKRTHQNKNALDFSMPIGTDIYAARGGVVVKVVESNDKTCFKKECAKFNNVITIYHKDGTFSSYAHIDTNGALVGIGEIIEKGQLIAKSGNIGYSSGPHLHFEVYNQKMGKREAIKTKFKINDGKESVYLVEKEIYTRNY